MLSSLSAALFLALPLASARPLLQGCVGFAKSLDLSSYNARVLNSTYYLVGQKNVSGLPNLMPFCEIFSTVSYGSNNSVIFANWLPDDIHYQNRFLAVGDGGMAGTLDYLDMLVQLGSGNGVAVAGGDGGHTAAANNGGNGAPNTYLPYLHNEEQAKAWIQDSIHIFTPVAKAITAQYYGREPAHSYYYGCSTGGAQGFALAQFYPDLFDGIYSGSPGNYYSHLMLDFLWNAQHTNTSATNLTDTKLQFITNATLDACDAIDGVRDGLIENPLNCHFDIETLACSKVPSYSSELCLTDAEIDAMKALYDGPVRSDNGQQIYPGFVHGGEQQLLLQRGELADSFTIPILQNMVFDDLQYDANTFNWASDVDTVNQRAGPVIDAISPDLSAFNARGSKMISTQGWADPLNSPIWPIQHLDQINDFFGGSQDFYQLYMVPGGGHCGIAINEPNVPILYNVVPALIQWIEKGQKPTEMKSDMNPALNGTTRKLCPWPQQANFTGMFVNDWNSYDCVVA